MTDRTSEVEVIENVNEIAIDACETISNHEIEEQEPTDEDTEDIEVAENITEITDEPTEMTSNKETEDNEKRHCWVCFATDEDDETAPWLKPCKCKGTTKWVHQLCLQRWVDQKQRGNSAVGVNCPQCGAAYLIAFPNMGQLMWLLDRVDAFIYKVCPFVAAGVSVGAIYWTAVTYGAITVMQVAGYQEGMALMEQADPFVLLVGLPTIPIFLILCKMVRWEDKVLRFIRFTVKRLPFIKYLLPAFRFDEEPQRISTTAVISDPVNATRVMCGALSFPTIATVVGRIFFSSVQDNLTQTLWGGTTFLAIKGIFKVYYKQQRRVMHSKRRIIEYQDDSHPNANEEKASTAENS